MPRFKDWTAVKREGNNLAGALVKTRSLNLQVLYLSEKRLFCHLDCTERRSAKRATESYEALQRWCAIRYRRLLVYCQEGLIST